MPEEKDLNNGQPVTAQDLNQPVTDDLKTPGQGKKLADGTDEDKKTVKYTEFTKVNEARKSLEQENESLRSQMQLLASQKPATQPQAPSTPYDQARIELGYGDVEYLTETERSRVISRATEIQNANYRKQVQAQSDQQFKGTHPDYGEVVGRQVGSQFLPSLELNKILSEKPWKASACSTAQGAYETVMEQRKYDELQQQNAVLAEHLKQTGIDTKLAPVSGAAAGGAAVVANTPAVLTAEQQAENERKVESGELKG